MNTLARIDVVGLEASPASEQPKTFLQASADWGRGRAPRSFPPRGFSSSSNVEWAAAHADVLAWINGNTENNFAKSLRGQYQAKGQLSPGQVDAVRSILGDPAAQARRQAAKVAAAPSVAGAGFDRLLQAFHSAEGTGLKRPKLQCRQIAFSYANRTSRNPGFVYVKIGGNYKGKITPEGKFIAAMSSVRDETIAPTYAETAEIIRIGRDPLAAAIEHGKLTGKCAICSRALDNPESVARGIGPICAKKFGW